METVVERASVCPIKDKKSANFNVWTACTTLAHLLEKTQDPPRIEDPQILFLDRGLFDSICWLTMMDRLERITTADREIIERFLRIGDWRKKMAGVVMMTTSPRDALVREAGYLPVEGAIGSIMNEDVLAQALETTRDCAKKYSSEFRILEVDTSSTDLRDNPTKTAEAVTYFVLALIEEHLREEILCLPRKSVTSYFAGKRAIDAKEAEELAVQFVESGQFRPRDEVEKDTDLVQAIPAVVVRNKTGDVLRLRRRERSEENVLHQKLVIWAGGL